MKLNSKIPYIDYLIVMCDIVRVKVRMGAGFKWSKDCVSITEYITTYSRILKIPKTICDKYEIEYDSEDKLIFELHQILKSKGQDFMTYNEWFKKYFE